MESEDQEFFEDIWRRIVADAEEHIEEWRRQARWIEEAYASGINHLPSPDEWYAAQRRSSKAFVQRWQQTFDLAQAINQGDFNYYLQRWHPAPTPNGASVSFVTCSEWSLTLTTDISRGQYDAFISSVYDEPADTVNKAAIWRKFIARSRAKHQRQDGPSYGGHVPTRQAGARGLGPRSSLRDWTRRVLRRR
jgi:hypothetical protein